jgi:hypothetical protein
VSLVSPETRALAERTASSLPGAPSHVELVTPLEGLPGSLDLLAASMRLVGTLAASTGFDPSRPKVSTAGRRLYHLSWANLADHANGARPYQMKALAAGIGPGDIQGRRRWREAFVAWSQNAKAIAISGIVLDYDGTCCSTADRSQPLPQEAQEALMRLFDEGIPIGIASGRGPSVVEALRAWIPDHYWTRTTIGLYNGGIVGSLSDNFPRENDCSGPLAEAADLLDAAILGDGWSITRRPWQVTIESTNSSSVLIGEFVSSVLGRRSELPLRVVTSGHSADVIPINQSKKAVIRYLHVDPTRVMTIGDQGHSAGNDFELLAACPLSLSVDRVSADPARCWNLSVDGVGGPALLSRYLRAIKTTRSGWYFQWPSLKDNGGP